MAEFTHVKSSLRKTTTKTNTNNATKTVEAGAPQVSFVSSVVSSNPCSSKPILQITNKNVVGGDWGDCLNDKEIDFVLSRFEIPHTPARMFFDLKNNTITKERVLSLLCKENGLCFAPVHVRHHWVLAVMKIENKNVLQTKIFDSAPSCIVKKDIEKMWKSLGLPHPAFAICPRQARGTNECGLFAIVNALAVHTGCEGWFQKGIVSLADMRNPESDWIGYLKRYTMEGSAESVEKDTTKKPEGSVESGPQTKARWSHQPYGGSLTSRQPHRIVEAIMKKPEGSFESGKTVTTVVPTTGVCTDEKYAAIRAKIFGQNKLEGSIESGAKKEVTKKPEGSPGVESGHSVTTSTPASMVCTDEKYAAIKARIFDAVEKQGKGHKQPEGSIESGITKKTTSDKTVVEKSEGSDATKKTGSSATEGSVESVKGDSGLPDTTGWTREQKMQFLRSYGRDTGRSLNMVPEETKQQRSYAEVARQNQSQVKPKPEGSLESGVRGGTREEIDVDDIEPVTQNELTDKVLHCNLLLQDAIDESKPGACVSCSNMDYLAQQVWRVAEDSIGGTKFDGKLLSSQAENLGNTYGVRWVIQPMYHNAHFVLVIWDSSNKTTATVWDSVPHHHPTERDNKIRKIFKVAKVDVVNNGPQKMNDCCFHTTYALSVFLSKATNRKVEYASTREDCMRIVVQWRREQLGSAELTLLQFYEARAKLLAKPEDPDPPVAQPVPDMITNESASLLGKTRDELAPSKKPKLLGKAEIRKRITPHPVGTIFRVAFIYKDVPQTWYGTLTKGYAIGLPAKIDYTHEECESCQGVIQMEKETYEIPFQGIGYFSVDKVDAIPFECRCPDDGDDTDSEDELLIDAFAPFLKRMQDTPNDNKVVAPQTKVTEQVTKSKLNPKAPIWVQSNSKTLPQKATPAVNTLDELKPIEVPVACQGNESGNCAPRPAAALKGNIGVKWFIHHKKPPHVHHLTWKQMSEGTRKGHIKWLEAIRAMPQPLLTAPLGTAIVELVTRTGSARRWAWGTTQKAFSDIAAALRALPLYTNEWRAIDVRSDPVFSAAYKRAQQNTRTAPQRAPIPLTKEVFTELVKEAMSAEARCLLILSWYLAGRVGDVRQLDPEDVVFGDLKKDKRELSATYRKGKTIGFRGPYTVPTLIPEDQAKCVTALHKKLPLTTAVQAELAKLVKTKGLELRSIRKGALLHMAANGVTLEEMIVFSGHTSVKTLRRYLNWGVADKATATRARAAAMTL